MYRNFVGFGKELFTDAGQYCIHFGYPAAEAAALQQRTLEARTGKQDLHVPEVSAESSTTSTRTTSSSRSSSSGKEIAVIHTYTGNQLVSKGLSNSINGRQGGRPRPSILDPMPQNLHFSSYQAALQEGLVALDAKDQTHALVLSQKEAVFILALWTVSTNCVKLAFQLSQ